MLDTKQKRGSVMLVGSPMRPWLSEPSGTSDVGGRLSLLRYFAGLAEAVVETIDPRLCITATDALRNTVAIADALRNAITIADRHQNTVEIAAARCC